MKNLTSLSFYRGLGALGVALATVLACGSSSDRSAFGDDAGTSSSGGFGTEGGLLGDSGDNGDISGRDPVSCDEAKQFRTYVGCDYYPTVTVNEVEKVFDFAVVVANVGTVTANVTITGPMGTSQTLSVAGGTLQTAYLPWVTALKGPSADDTGGGATSLTSSVLAKASAFHLVSDIPVVVYQFNALEFKGVGGPPGKDWSSCIPLGGDGTPCYSYTNDASLLLPSTAMTGNYRIMGSQGQTRSASLEQEGGDLEPPFFAVTGTADGTTVTVTLPQKGKVVAGSGITAVAAGGTLTFNLDQGDVAEIIGGVGENYDFSGALLKASNPVQVITGVACMDFPKDVQACDHIEETLFPVETLGKHYVYANPSSPKDPVGMVLHFYGDVDATTLTYTPSKPSGCPDFLNAGQMADCGVVTDEFEVTADHEFGLGMFMVGGSDVDPDAEEFPQGDPSETFAVAVEQYRSSYVFLAPPDYDENYVDILAPGGTTLTLDGSDVSSKLAAVTGTAHYVAHVQLGAGQNGAHTLKASNPVGIQVLGYGENTSYMYPGGLNLSTISAVPVK